MTLYHGGKQKIGKELAEIIYNKSMDISEEENFEIKGYCEPFCGMLGVYRHIPDLFGSKIKYKAGDTNKSVIMMWMEAQKGWIPPTRFNETKYNKLKKSKDIPSAINGFIGYQLGFCGQYFNGYSPNYGLNINSLKKTSEKIVNIATVELDRVKFSYGDYGQFSRLKGYIIYCDPPYNNTKQKYEDKFDSDKFWVWCKYMSINNIIFVSEYTAPKGIKKIYEKKVSLTGFNGNNKIKNRTEKLFVI